MSHSTRHRVPPSGVGEKVFPIVLCISEDARRATSVVGGVLDTTVSSITTSRPASR
jgi:hypothetical protein